MWADAWEPLKGIGTKGGRWGLGGCLYSMRRSKILSYRVFICLFLFFFFFFFLFLFIYFIFFLFVFFLTQNIVYLFVVIMFEFNLSLC